jgi:branched-chain amino acid transport system ATP-binding protein
VKKFNVSRKRGPSVRDSEKPVVEPFDEKGLVVHVSLTVGQSEIVGIFGHNGAGKTTLLNAIGGVHRGCELQAYLNGNLLHGMVAQERARSGLLLVREGGKVFSSLTVAEHLEVGRRLGRLNGRGAKSAEFIYETFPLLANLRKKTSVQLSGGQRQILILGTALAANPACMILDEPSTGLSPQTLDIVGAAITDFAGAGAPVLIAEQNPTWLSQLASRAYLLSLGRIESEGSPNDLFGAGRPESRDS